MDFAQFKVRSTRQDALANNNAHFFSHRFSKYIAYSFYKIGFSANAVTWFFLLFGILSAFFLWAQFSLLSYFFWRLHIITDMADGEVARATGVFSKAADGFDRSNHLIINTAILYAGTSCIENPLVIIILIITFFLYYNFNSNYFIEKRETRQMTFIAGIIRDLLSLDGFILFAILLQIISATEYQIILSIAYSCFFLLMFLRKLQIFIVKP